MKLKKNFYLQPALDCVQDFLGKKLVYKSPKGKITGIIFDVEAYPANVDEVHHGNKRTPRTEVMYKEGGYAYVYLIYGTWHQFAVVVNKKGIPDVVFIRGIMPLEGVEIMKKNYHRPVNDPLLLTNSPGKLCKSFAITKELYGIDLTGNTLFLEDLGINIDRSQITKHKRVGISSKYKGFDSKLRFTFSPKILV